MTGTPTNDPYDPDVARALETFDLRDAMIAGLAAGTNDLTDAAHALIGVARLSRLEKIVALTLLAVNTVGMLGIAVTVVLMLLAQHDADRQRDAIGRVLTEIQSCTTPDGECAKRGADGTSKALDRILQTQVVVKECDRLLPAPGHTQREFEKCVADRIARLPK